MNTTTFNEEYSKDFQKELGKVLSLSEIESLMEGFFLNRSTISCDPQQVSSVLLDLSRRTINAYAHPDTSPEAMLYFRSVYYAIGILNSFVNSFEL